MKPLTWHITDRATGRVCAMFETDTASRLEAYRTADAMGYPFDAYWLSAELPEPAYLAPRAESDRMAQRRRFMHRRKA